MLMILCWAPFIAVLGHIWPTSCGMPGFDIKYPPIHISPVKTFVPQLMVLLKDDRMFGFGA